MKHIFLTANALRKQQKHFRETLLSLPAEICPTSSKKMVLMDFAQEGVEFDKKITDAMSRRFFTIFCPLKKILFLQATECGLKPCIVMAGALETKKVDAKLYSYEGPFGVGYAVASYKVINQERK